MVLQTAGGNLSQFQNITLEFSVKSRWHHPDSQPQEIIDRTKLVIVNDAT
jgi:hypothetical protein